ncbi:MAG: phosphate ABC transporter substrate-binding protein PstS [Acidobacteria bacterium]|nr:phosphate ABC transporter substrate-binding protein PstS [Acidobacteriota bacterium]
MRTNKSIAFMTIAAALGLSAAAFAQTQITGAGATFPNPIYQKWFSEFRKAHGDVQINYQAIGSGGGIKQVTMGTVDFGASDAIMTDQQITEFKAARKTNILALPTVAGAAVATYNIPGVASGLNLTAEALSGIFLGKITKWNDPAIAGANKGVKLPAADIVVVHRSDGSGTTFCWTDYLAKVSPEWKSKVGSGASVNWPLGLGAKGNDGVAGQVKQTPNSIGYVELIYAENQKMPFANVKNAAGAFVKPNLASITAAAAGVAKTMPDDFRISITNAPGKDAYPISTFTWLLVPEKSADANKGKVIKAFVEWALGPGQAFAEPMTFARLPKEVLAKELKALAKVQ